MNYGRGFPLPNYGMESWIAVNVIPPENGIGQNQSSRTAPPMFGGQFSQGDEGLCEVPRKRIVVDEGIVCESWMTPTPIRPIGNGMGIHHGNATGFVQNDGIWNLIRHDNANGSWIPVTPGNLKPQTSNVNKPMENENWGDLVGMYQGLLQKETLNLNEVAQDHYQDYGNLNRVPSTPNKNVNRIPNSTHVPNTTYNMNANQASPSVSYFPSKDPANWEDSLLAAIVRPKTRPVSDPFNKQPQNNSVYDLNKTPVQNSISQVGSMHQDQQLPIFSQKDGFSVPCRPCYDLNSPPRSELDAISSRITGQLPFAPVTPNTQQKDRLESQTVEDGDNHYVVDSASSAVSTTQKERLVLQEGEELGIDLNKTPNQKTPARRKKHRPKVIREGKPKRTQTPKDPNRVKRKYVRKTPPENAVEKSPNGKRKYVRRMVADQSDGQQKTRAEKATKAVVETPTKSCRRQLNFDSEHVVSDEDQNKEMQGTNLMNNPHDIEQERRINSILKRSAMNAVQNNMYAGVTTHQESPINRIQSEPYGPSTPMTKARDHALNVVQNNMFAGHVTTHQESPITNIQAELYVPSTPMTKARDHALNVVQNKMLAGVTTHQESPITNIPAELYGATPMTKARNHALNVVHSNTFAYATTHQESPITSMQSDLNGSSTPMTKARDHALNLLARNLTMRNRYNQVCPVSTDLEGRKLNGQAVNFDEIRGVKRPSLEQINSCNLNAMDSLYVYQKLLLARDNCVDRSNELSRIMESHKKPKMQNDLPVPRPEDNSRGELRRPAYGNVSAMQLISSCMKKVNNPSYQVNGQHFQPPMAAATPNLQKHPGSSGMQPIMERSQRSTQGQVNPVNAMVRWNQMPDTPPKDYSRSPVVTSPAPLLDKKRTAIQSSPSQRSNKPDNMSLQLCKDASGVHQISFTTKGRPRKQKGGISIEDITCMLEGLCIYEEKGRNALVPYRGDNAIIPFEPVKKRKPRPKVDLDPETDRLWRLLMGNEGSEATETMDKDKEKWWEDERRVFRGRADSFIARMHLVQGDRRFSRWKGSVVDSVIGVFLTQNVSDHLSSSAFMSLAAKFSPKTRSTNETHCQGGACVLVEEPIETILPTDKIRKQPTFNQRPFVSYVSSDHLRSGHSIPSTNFAANKQYKASEELIISQDSLNSSIIQIIDESRSSSGSNSETEDQTIGLETSKGHHPATHTRAEKVTMFNQLFSQDKWTTPQNNRSQYMHHLPKTPIPSQSQMNKTTGLPNVGAQDCRLLGGENRSSLPSTKSGVTNGYHTSNATYQQNMTPQGHQYDFLGGHHPPPGKPDTSAQKQDSCSVIAGMEASSKEPNSGSHNPLNGQHKSISKGGKGISEDEKKKGFDWDSLRRDVLLNCEKKQRNKDATDSLDYEALRRAHVNEISDAIRERGMNNLLADRIKDFLDRLIRDHGSIDLEWLRDVPPDKAKDYLLSIRGLGLKSVECVRLLTLHHLAFPVDTNVGRIAVRLGWVPLQPLPESLQLHLLEMYPVLESIQKYLWPRLCKMDQLTLYELHYQMITFGKVFCTKSKPNCNACPMRAECRHFASAFASARLALPGPEEKRMVPSDAPNSTNATYRTQPVISEPMQLPPAENNCNKNAQFLCEPIIEEPSTPEPEAAELSLSDIEDQYYDDADEIPTIKLDMNEFTANLQKSMEIQGDMSKALVALNPQAASIPTPKLKNVSRLRTEHLVYELPDSHPILKGLYEREPDDPSPYLLAIWTPGETAHSMQPPERGCQAQESGMLCDRTTCFSCNCIKEANSQVVRGTILMPCRTATRGSFPLNGTYFQVNEMFADHASSLNPIDVPRAWIWNLPRRTVYFGTSVSTIFKGLTTQEIQQCFWRGFVCVRGFDQKMRAPRPLMARLHFPASKLVNKTKKEDK